MRPAQLIHDPLGPVEVLALALDWPVSGRRGTQISEITDLVSKLDELCCPARACRVLDL